MRFGKSTKGLIAMRRMTNYLFVISFDGLSTLDFKTLSMLPNFCEFLKKASYSKKVYSVYPTLTYPAHATIVTGKYPKNHGIVNNTLLQTNRNNPDWYWQRKYIKGETFYDQAIEKGMKVAALLWPVTAQSKIQYNMPEVVANRPWENQILVSLINGSPIYQFNLNQKFGYLRKGLRQPELDDFVQQSLLYTIRELRPDLTLVHFTDLDSLRHYHGFHSKEASEALQRHDQRLGELIQTLKEMNIYEECTLAVLGDHSSLDEDKIIRLNILLRDKGYIQVNSKGWITDYKAIVKSCDGSAYVYLKNKEDRGNLQFLHRLYNCFKEFNQRTQALEAIYSNAEATELGADPQCAFMLEANHGYIFTDDVDGEIIHQILPEEVGFCPHHTKAAHGYSPYKKDYTTIFLLSGKGIREKVILPEMSLVDEGPTLAKLLGVNLKDTDGRILQEFLEE
jgi:predicted AlkP superfamily pyrophosphatase or phosphodiesterase